MERPLPRTVERVTLLRESTVLTKMALTAAAIAALAVIAGFFVFDYAAAERQRALRDWQNRLGMIADTRAASVNQWVDAQFEELTNLSQNASLQLYLTELVSSARRGSRNAAGLAREGYLQNLLTYAAERSGFTAPRARSGIPANVQFAGTAGIALVGLDGKTFVATNGTPAIKGRLAAFLRSAVRGEPATLDIYIGASGAPTMAFAVPIFAVQGGTDASQQLGWVVGIRTVGEALFARLEQPGIGWKSAEALLVRKSGAGVDYLSPTSDGRGPLKRTLSLETPGLAAAFAIDNAGGFGTKQDYRNHEVLVTSRPVSRTSWTLLYKIDRSEALRDSEARITGIVSALLMAVVLVLVALIAIWRHGTSQRTARALARYEDLAKRHESQRELLRLVTDSQPSPMFILDDSGTYRFANRAASDLVRIDKSEMVGKSLASVVGPAEARRFERLRKDVIAEAATKSEIYRTATDGELKIVHTECIPVSDEALGTASVLIVEQDITSAVSERERSERVLRQLVQTLVTLVDQRDPFAANHSAQVAKVARAVAEEMGLDEEEVETAAIAGSLMNVGKILVSEELLSRAGDLNETEMRQIRESIRAAADLLSDVEFRGPVVETLRQLHEHWDGSGSPCGLSGDQILLSARIVSVANAFVAMINPRAWRPGSGVDDAIENVMGEIGQKFDRRVVAALVNRLDNRGASVEWTEADPQLVTV